MDLDQLLNAPVAKRRRLADETVEPPSGMVVEAGYSPQGLIPPQNPVASSCTSAVQHASRSLYVTENKSILEPHIIYSPTSFSNPTTCGLERRHRYFVSQRDALETFEPPRTVHISGNLRPETTEPFNGSLDFGKVQDTGQFLGQECAEPSRPVFDEPMQAGSGHMMDTELPCPEPRLQGSEIVCFGVLSSIPAKCNQSGTVSIPERFPAEITSSDSFAAQVKGLDIRGRISDQHAQMIHGMLEETSLRLEVSCTMESETPSKAVHRVFSQRPCLLNFTLYGPLELLDEIGSFFEEGYEMYLQDPLQVGGQDFRYCNPHRISSDDPDSCPLLSEFLAQSSHLTRFEAIPQQPDLLEILSSHTELEEHPQPQAIRTNPKRHQKQALTFMRRREQGWAFDSGGQDIWEAIDDHRGLHFLNRVAGTYEREEPPPLRGGIIADPMGLGKTLTMIALAAIDQDSPSNVGPHIGGSQNAGNRPGATLIIVPPPLLGSWEEQVFEHAIKGTMSLGIHHGKSKITQIKEFDRFDIVVTTYQTVSAEWKEGHGERKSILFSRHWRRLILDEAHFIRNERSAMCRAVCHLEANARWAVTGTPIQNRLDDLASLLKFVRAHPYDDTKNFKAHISALWKSGEDEEAVKRVKFLSSCLLLRRPKATISLPPRHDLLCPVGFRSEERRLYESAREQAISNIDEALQCGPNQSNRGGYINALQRIESLRLICNLGLHYHSRQDTNNADLQNEENSWQSIAQQTFNCQRDLDSIICIHCSSNLELTEAPWDGPINSRKAPQFFRCLKFCCAECYTHLSRSRQRLACGHPPCCPAAPVSLNPDSLESNLSVEAEQSRLGLRMPSKIQALLTDVKSLSQDEKCIIFSTWRLTLDLVEVGLKQASIQCVRFDGKVPQKERQNVVERFRKDPGVRVMLLTLSCGAVGLTLTSASRAYLMEPHWNPTLEEQALARIHRLGQTREVTTVRFYVRNSFEEQVIELQANKKRLAGVLLSPHDGDKTDDNLGTLHKLRALL